MISAISDFERNFVSAWEVNNASTFPPHGPAPIDKTPMVTIFVQEKQLDVPIFTHDAGNVKLLKQLRMFYRFMKTSRGFTELVLPMQLTRIDIVKVRLRHKRAGL
jgi:hypothetical protein